MTDIFNKEIITAWIAVLGAFGAVGKYFLDAYREKASVRAAFLVEIDRLLWVVKRHRNWFGTGNADPLIPFTTDLYDRQIENVGKLAKPLAVKVIKFYGFIKFLNQIQASRAAYRESNRSADFDKFYTAQLKDFDSQFEKLFDADFDSYHIEATHQSANPATAKPAV